MGKGEKLGESVNVLLIHSLTGHDGSANLSGAFRTFRKREDIVNSFLLKFHFFESSKDGCIAVFYLWRPSPGGPPGVRLLFGRFTAQSRHVLDALIWCGGVENLLVVVVRA